ncbi:UNVERIFIED_ORG: hypothetical protein ABIC54_002158 [Burkholderia sp. 1263]
MANAAHHTPIARREPVSFAGFAIIAPCGLLYFPPCRTLAEAYAEIRDRSLYEGEPGWTIQRTDEDGDPIGRPANARVKPRRLSGAKQSSRGEA